MQRLADADLRSFKQQLYQMWFQVSSFQAVQNVLGACDVRL